MAALQYFNERERRRAEEQREAKAQASKLTAWVAIHFIGDARQSYGVVISNTSGSTFHDVTVSVLIHGIRARAITLAILPPGFYYVRHIGGDEKFEWDFPAPVEGQKGTLRPYMKSDRYQLKQIEFADNLNQHWVSNSYAVLSIADDRDIRGNGPA